MKAMRLHAVRDFRLEEVPIPEPSGDEILVKIGACGVCGSDIPRVYQLGTRSYPITIGHEFSGTVVKVGNKKDQSLVGNRVAVFPLIPCLSCDSCQIGEYCQCEDYNYLGSRCDGGFAEYCLVPSKWHLIVSNNPDVSLEELAMSEPACVAQHAIRRGNVTAGQTVAVLGAGPIGIMVARWAKLFGASDVILTDIDDQKQQFAQERGFKVINSRKSDLKAEIHALTNGVGIDVVIEGTGSSAGINDAITIARTGGTVVWMGNPHTDTNLQLSSHSLLLRKELEMYGVWNSHYANTPINEWEYTVQMLDKGLFKVHDLITHQSNLVELKKLFDDVHEHNISICKAMYSAALD